MSTIDWLGLIVLFVAYFAMLVVDYVWKGRREKRLHETHTGRAWG